MSIISSYSFILISAIGSLAELKMLLRFLDTETHRIQKLNLLDMSAVYKKKNSYETWLFKQDSKPKATL